MDDLREIGRQLAAAADEATDLLLVYYAGHGIIAGQRRELYLGLPGSDHRKPYFSALEFDKLRRIVVESDAATKIVILDCCFSGLGDGEAMTGGAAEISEMFEVGGACVIASAPRESLPLAVAGERHTALSGRLITVLRDGVPEGPELLSADDIFQRLIAAMRSDDLALPWKHDVSRTGSAPVAYNRALAAAEDPGTTIELIRIRAEEKTPAEEATDQGAMSEACRVMLRAAALLGSRFYVSSLATVLGERLDRVIPVINEAVALGILAEGDGSVGFQNEPLWKAMYDDISPGTRVPWHRKAGLALASADAPVECVARQMLHATTAAVGARLEKWMLDWLQESAGVLIGQAPGLAAELLQNALHSIPFDSSLYAWLASRLADAHYRLGNLERAEQVAYGILDYLDYVPDPDLLIDLQWTLAQCAVFSGQSEQALATLTQERTTLELSPRHRARLLVYLAQLNCNLGRFTTAGEDAEEALSLTDSPSSPASSSPAAGGTWEAGWALQVLATVRTRQGEVAASLPYFDRALTMTRSEPALVDLRLLLQISRAATLGALDRHHEAIIVLSKALHRAGRAGTAIRVAQAASLLGRTLFETGLWDQAVATITDSASLKEPAVACADLSTIAMMGFHHGRADEARQALAEAARHSVRLGQRFLSQFALAQSLDRELDGDRHGALAALTSGLNRGTEELGEVEYVLPDAVRLALELGDRQTAHRLACHAVALAEGSPVPHREAAGLYCQGLTTSCPEQLLAAAERYSDARRPLYAAKAYEAAADLFGRAGGEDGMEKARAAVVRAVETYESLNAEPDLARVRDTYRHHDMKRSPLQRLSLAAGIAGARTAPSIPDQRTPSERSLK